ncbi:MAG TPA: hypothetical protein VEB64_09490 [Azospirillaceae bacterium]|nr:hypothetical protein [Azospirillaceae bacterium]
MANLVDANGKLMSRDALKGFIAAYNAGNRGAKEFAAIPRALVIVMDNLTVGKTTYVKCADGTAQLARRKDKTIATL